MDAIFALRLGARSCAGAWILFGVAPGLVAAAADNTRSPSIAASPSAAVSRLERDTSPHRPSAKVAIRLRGADTLPALLRIPTRLADDVLSYRAEVDRRGLRPFDLRSVPVRSAKPVAAPAQPLRLTLTDAQLQRIIARIQPETTYAAFGQFDDVTVLAPSEPVPMRDVTQEVWGGIAAPVWAVLHPTQAWRILLPIPPR